MLQRVKTLELYCRLSKEMFQVRRQLLQWGACSASCRASCCICCFVYRFMLTRCPGMREEHAVLDPAENLAWSR